LRYLINLSQKFYCNNCSPYSFTLQYPTVGLPICSLPIYFPFPAQQIFESFDLSKLAALESKVLEVGLVYMVGPTLEYRQMRTQQRQHYKLICYINNMLCISMYTSITQITRLQQMKRGCEQLQKMSIGTWWARLVFLRSWVSPFSNEPLTWGQRNLPQISRLANLLLHRRISYKNDICWRGNLNGRETLR